MKYSMKHAVLFIIGTLVILIAVPALAFDITNLNWTATAGIRYHITDSSAVNCSYPLSCSANNPIGYELGASTKIEMMDSFYFLTGALLVNRIAEVSYNHAGVGSGVAGYNFWHLDIPVQAQYKILDWLYAEGGIDLAIKISSNCYATGPDSCSGASNDNSFIFPIRVGASFVYDKTWSGRMYYEMATPLTSTSTFPSRTYQSSALGIIGGYNF